MYVVGYPRSGNTWLCYLLAYTLNSEYDDRDDPGVHPRSGSQRRYVKGGLAHTSYQSRLGRVLKTHALDPSSHDGEPVVYLVRDGRDALVSYYFYQQRPERQATLWALKSGRVALVLRRLGVDKWTQNATRSSFSGFVHKYAPDWACHTRTWLARDLIAVVRYEDLCTNPMAALNDLLDRLDAQVNPDIVQRGIDLFSFRQLSGRQAGQEHRESFFRKGTSGDWKNHFDEEITARFYETTGDLVTRLGYEI